MEAVEFEFYLNAIRNNDLKEIKRLIEAGYSPNMVFEENGFSPLHLAAWYDRPQIIKFLREQGAKVNKREAPTKKTALHIAAYFGHLDSCKALVEENSAVNAEDEATFLPLYYAALQGHLDVVQFLADYLTGINESSFIGSAIGVAIKHKNIEIIDYLLNRLQRYYFPGSRKSKSFSFVQFLKNATLPVSSGNPFYYATLIGAADIIRLLLRKRYFSATASVQEKTPLHLAAERGHSEVVRLLMNDSAYSTYENMYMSTPLELAMLNGHSHTVKIFTECGEKPWLIDKVELFGNRPTSTLAAAIWDGNYGKLKEILEHEGKEILFKKDKERDDLPLQIAIQCRQIEIGKLFIKYGGKELVLQRDGFEMMALHRAAFHGVLEFYQLMFEIGGPEVLKQPAEVFGTPLDCALYEDCIEVVEWTLLQPSLGCSFEELFQNQSDNWVLMDINPMIGGYFTKMEKLLGSNFVTPH